MFSLFFCDYDKNMSKKKNSKKSIHSVCGLMLITKTMKPNIFNPILLIIIIIITNYTLIKNVFILLK